MEISKIDGLIHVIRGHRIMLDADLAALYGVATGNLNKAVSRNPSRFPPDFMFGLTFEESSVLIFQFGRSKTGRGGSRFLPNAFTEQGVAMLSSVLRSQRAIDVNVAIMREFVRLRSAVPSGRELGERVRKVERTQEAQELELGEHAVQIHEVFAAIRSLRGPSSPKRKK